MTKSKSNASNSRFTQLYLQVTFLAINDGEHAKVIATRVAVTLAAVTQTSPATKPSGFICASALMRSLSDQRECVCVSSAAVANKLKSERHSLKLMLSAR